jgi:hypothetical protein
MRTLVRCISVVFALAACGGPRHAAMPAPAVLPRDLAGCYALPGVAREEFGVTTILLDTALLVRPREFAGESRWAAARVDAAGRRIPQEGPWPVLYWTPHWGPDSVRIMMGHGWGGVALFLATRARGDTLRGAPSSTGTTARRSSSTPGRPP